MRVAPNATAQPHEVHYVQPQVTLLELGNIRLRTPRVIGKIRLAQTCLYPFALQDFPQLSVFVGVEVIAHCIGGTLPSTDA